MWILVILKWLLGLIVLSFAVIAGLVGNLETMNDYRILTFLVIAGFSILLLRIKGVPFLEVVKKILAGATTLMGVALLTVGDGETMIIDTGLAFVIAGICLFFVRIKRFSLWIPVGFVTHIFGWAFLIDSSIELMQGKFSTDVIFFFFFSLAVVIISWLLANGLFRRKTKEELEMAAELEQAEELEDDVEVHFGFSEIRLLRWSVFIMPFLLLFAGLMIRPRYELVELSFMSFVYGAIIVSVIVALYMLVRRRLEDYRWRTIYFTFNWVLISIVFLLGALPQYWNEPVVLIGFISIYLFSFGIIYLSRKALFQLLYLRVRSVFFLYPMLLLVPIVFFIFFQRTHLLFPVDERLINWLGVELGLLYDHGLYVYAAVFIIFLFYPRICYLEEIKNQAGGGPYEGMEKMRFRTYFVQRHPDWWEPEEYEDSTGPE